MRRRFGHAVSSRSTDACPRCDEPLSTTQKDALRRAVRLGGHDLLDEPAEWLDPGRRFAAPEEPGPVDVPGGEILERPAALVLVLDPDGPTGRRRPAAA
jgi:hypothetical protein